MYLGIKLYDSVLLHVICKSKYSDFGLTIMIYSGSSQL